MGSASAQGLQKMSYQAVLRNSSDALVANTNVGMQVSILQGSAEGAAVYVERHFPKTNANGLVTTEIGAGTVVSGTFAAIDWSAGPYFIKTETDLNGGANYTVTGISQLLSVPYALYAEKAGTVELSATQIESLKGANGLQGEQGPAGNDGAPGKDGADGLSAFDLWKSQAGNETKTEADYFQATKGIDGKDGINGKDGADGVPGKNGADGLSAFELWQSQAGNETKTEADYFAAIKGIDGKDGVDGKDGIDGADGAPGKNGVDGLSAFDLWIAQAGNETKTEADYFLATKGIDGKDGVDGKDGIDGKDGAPGKNGANGLSAFELWSAQAGNETKTEADFLVATKGEKGDKGDTGEQGVAGKDCLTTSVNGVTQVNGEITLTKTNIGLGNVDNTTDLAKPISTATQTALDAKAAKATTLAGYGITDAVDLSSNQTIAGNKNFTGAVAANVTGNLTGNVTGSVNANNTVVTNVATPVAATDAATKAYVDALKQQIKVLENTLITAGTYKLEDVDGNKYKVVKIGTQVWMAENLKTTKYNDGTAIPNVTDATAWCSLTTGAQCDYNNTASNTATYGKLYNWYAVNTAKLCPSGWHVPTHAEWTTLTEFVGGDVVAGCILKETGITHWSIDTYATNSFGFTALPGGCRASDCTFGNKSFCGYWWNSTVYSATSAWFSLMDYSNNYLFQYYNDKSSGMSVRCLRD